LRIAAIICARNEELHIARCLNDLVRNDVEVFVIDHDSEDRTVQIAESYLGRGLLAIERLPWRGKFELGEQLSLKKEIITRLNHDWILHVDSDEWLCAPKGFQSLSNAIKRVDAEGFNCINFDEMVFVPWPNEDFTCREYSREMKTYYFFEPSHRRLMRGWRRDIVADNTGSGGHGLASDRELRLYPQNFILRHYIALSLAHAVKKYVGRQFADDELKKGWHVNRRGIKDSELVLTPSPYLRQLQSWDSGEFDRSVPAKAHFWEWNRPLSLPGR
jgi:glycosyltransferase involved in cell wall biosynthesis